MKLKNLILILILLLFTGCIEQQLPIEGKLNKKLIYNKVTLVVDSTTTNNLLAESYSKLIKSLENQTILVISLTIENSSDKEFEAKFKLVGNNTELQPQQIQGIENYFPKTIIKPNETISGNKVFFIPKEINLADLKLVVIQGIKETKIFSVQLG